MIGYIPLVLFHRIIAQLFNNAEYQVLFSAFCPVLVCFHCAALILANVTSCVGLV